MQLVGEDNRAHSVEMRDDSLFEGNQNVFCCRRTFKRSKYFTMQLSDAQVLAKIMDVCQRESIEYSDDGLEAVVFTAQGDMRQGNSLIPHFNIP